MLKYSNTISYWEKHSFISVFDLIVIGSGIVGINAAIAYKKKYPSHKVLVIERGSIPTGASTKNAGFACFGSPSELIADFSKTEENIVLETIEMRWNGFKRLRKIVGDKNLEYQQNGGFEVFDSEKKFNEVVDQLKELNKKLTPITKAKETFKINCKKITDNGLKGFSGLIESLKEGQLNPGKMMFSLMEIACKLGVFTWNENVNSFEQLSNGVQLKLESGIELNCKNLIIATNGFAKQLVRDINVIPARTQVLITSPIKKLKLKGVFHYDEGYFYFRNVGDRVLLGGGRNLDFKNEETDQFGTTKKIQDKLEEILYGKILPGKNFIIEHRWSGIMGLGSEKKPIIKHLSKNVVIAVRMGGMGVAIGTLVGEMAANEI